VIEKAIPYLTVFASALVAVLILTPLVRVLHIRLGMVDKPDPRRINKVPIPRGGGLALVVGVLLSYSIFHVVSGRPYVQGITDEAAHRMVMLSVAIMILGWFDDRYSLSPKVKLVGQVVIAALAWAWAGLGFSTLWPSLPAWIDCVMTVFWIVGAVNAFNLIDGLDGLASGLALIAVVGMGGALFFAQNPQANFFYFAMAGGLLGFLRYNWHPASIFLGDSGSMFIGFVVSTLPLASQEPNSFLVSVGVPLLAMGVPIFDTTLAILRRSLRRFLSSTENDRVKGEVMQADSDHLHHRLLRATGLNQRKTALILYGLSAAGVAFGLIAMMLESKSAGVWLIAFAFAAVVIFKDSYIEILDAGRLATDILHTKTIVGRRRLARLEVPLYVAVDVVVLVAAYFATLRIVGIGVEHRSITAYLPLRVGATFVALVCFRTYSTIWSRALLSNYVRLFAACACGSAVAALVIYYWPSFVDSEVVPMTVVYLALTFFGVLMARIVRRIFRDVFYAVDCGNLVRHKDVSRVLVYGAGLRYSAFRRELVRSAAANSRIIVGLVDDNVYLKGRYIGGLKILGTLNDIPKLVNEYNADAVVIACDVTDEWLKVVKDTLAPLNVKVTHFFFKEETI